MKQSRVLMRKVGRGVMTLIAGFSMFVLVVLVVLFVKSPGKVKPYLDGDGAVLKNSISEKGYVSINGSRQGMFIRGQDVSNPVLLFVHGGPGMPEYFLADSYPTGLEEYFTVCWWEQRGAGLSYSKELQPEDITVDILVSDIVEASKYLSERFGQEKIYLMGHSWGSFLGIQAAAREPELYHAYLGMSQISRQSQSEQLAYDYMLEQYRLAGNKKMAEQMEAYNIYESEAALASFKRSSLRDKAMHELGVGTMHQMDSVVTDIFLPVMLCPAYTLTEKVTIWRAKALLGRNTELRSASTLADMPTLVPELEIPVYFFGGQYDYTVSYVLAAEYLQSIKAPVKGFYTFEQSAHSPLFEEPERFVDIMLTDVLTGGNGLADGNTNN